jgi:hypothetical protein
VHWTLSGADFFPILAQPIVDDLEPLAHRTLSGAHRTVLCSHQTVGSATRHARIARPTVGSADRWLTAQSGAPIRPLARPRVTRGLRGRPLARPTVGSPDSPLHHRIVRCSHQTVGSATRHARIARPTVGSADRWLTGQSGAPPDSPVIFSRTPPTNSRE